jgi:hypothetical protein
VQDVVGQLPVLPYDAQSAHIHAELRTQREQSGQTLVPHNTHDFMGLGGLRMVDWFDVV